MNRLGPFHGAPSVQQDADPLRFPAGLRFREDPGETFERLRKQCEDSMIGHDQEAVGNFERRKRKAGSPVGPRLCAEQVVM